MANFLQVAAKALAGILSPKKKQGPYAPGAGGSTGLDMGPVESPAYVPPAPINKQPIGLEPEMELREQPHMKKLFQGIEDAQGVLARPLPKLEQPNPTLLEGLGSVLLAGANPFAASKTLAVPGQMAQARADAVNQPLLQNFQLGRENAQSTIDTNSKIIGMEFTRDAVSERVKSSEKLQSLKSKSTRELAELRGDTDSFKLLANLAGKGELTVPTLTEYYLRKKDALGNYLYDEEEAGTLASDTIQFLQSNPSAAARLKAKAQEDKAQTDNAKLAEAERNNHRKTVRDVNATYDEKLNSIMALADLGDPWFAKMTFAEMQQSAATKGAKTLDTESNTAYKQMKTQLEPRVFAQRQQEFNKKFSFLQSSHKDKMAATWARVQVSKNLVEIAQQNANTAEGRLAVAELKADLDANRDEAEEAFNEAMDELELKKVGEKNPSKVDKIDAEIEYLQNQYWGKIASKAGLTPNAVAADPWGSIGKVVDEATKKPLAGPIGTRGGRGTAQGNNPPVPPGTKPKKIKPGQTKTFPGGIKVTRL